MLAFTLRLYNISGNNVFFYFDQARDAVVSTSIISNLDFKIMGPSVSGTNDSVYHGVLYYYVIAPIYFLTGNPTIVAGYLGLLSLFGIVITYKIGATVFKSKKIGLLAAFFQSISVINIHQNTWLSNPTLSSIFVPLTYYFIWKIFLSNKTQDWLTYAGFGLSLALAVQSALQNITILGSFLLIFIYSLFVQKMKPNIKYLFFSGATFMFGISSMILTELLMIKRGILSFQSLNLNQHEISLLQSIPKIISKYFQVISNILAPNNYSYVIVILLICFILLFVKLKQNQLIWTLSFIFASVWLLLWHYRDPPHTFIGVEVVVFILLASAVVKLCSYKSNYSKILVFILVLIFVLNNFFSLISWRAKQFHYLGIQNGGYLNNQLALIDKTYNIAGGKEFSISSLTSPYAINTTWDYLYRWYGQSKYGYTPFYVGIDQKYFITTNVLEEKSQPENIHFLIFEPDTTLSDEIVGDFVMKQKQYFDIISKSQTFYFGSISLEFIKDQETK